ncbi:MAG: hypothetical protein M4579_006114 [Chaenotheca gracillima]|nr:MAG: hypothetical protein M4579_006114 [Chaenotheca gracillima]
MAGGTELSKAKVILLAVHLATECKFAPLQALIASNPRTLGRDLALRIILSFVPESADPAKYVPLLQSLQSGPPDNAGRYSGDTSSVDSLDEAEARRKVKKLRLLSLSGSYQPLQTTDAFTSFLIHRARLIDAQTGLLDLTFQVIQPFVDHSKFLQTWFISTLLPLVRLNYEYFPDQNSTLSLADFEQLRGQDGVDRLLSPATLQRQSDNDDEVIGKDLRGIVGPWIYGGTRNKRRKLESEDTEKRSERSPPELGASVRPGDGGPRSWQDVFSWLVSAAPADFSLCVSIIDQWDGPADVDLGGYGDRGHDDQDVEEEKTSMQQYVRAALAVAYLAPDGSLETLTGAHRILTKAAQLLGARPPRDLDSSVMSLQDIVIAPDTQIKSSHALSVSHALLQADNSLTAPVEASLSFLNAAIISAFIFARLGQETTIRRVVQLYFNDETTIQSQELQKVVRNVPNASSGDEKYWRQLRAEIRWLWNWNQDTLAGGKASKGTQQEHHGLFGRLDQTLVERELLRAFLAHTRCDLAIATYLQASDQDRPLPLEDVERVVYDSAMNFYDNATNCNRTRGGMKKASDIIKAFYPSQFPDSTSLKRSERLLVATHALSFYSLTLHHGVPFQPVNIRIHPDPILLLGKVLEQNSKGYTNLDDLLDIGRNLVEAGLIKPSSGVTFADLPTEQRQRLLSSTERRIIGMSIEAALAEDDFETAYSYTLNRFSTSASNPSPGGDFKQPTLADLTDQDDISWRAAFQAGRYKSARPTKRSATNANPDIRRLEMRMELLAQALNLAPAAALPEILGVWRRCEEELNLLVSQETEEEERWDDRGDQKIPGQFMTTSPAAAAAAARHGGRAAAYEDAPMGLFDVARGAASALSKSAFPLRGSGSGSQAKRGAALGKSSSSTSLDNDDARSFDETGRVRKRDVVSNMVTGGLASGIGWVLGAKPVPSPEQEEA